MSEQPFLCSHLCIIRMGPIKSPVSLYFLVILPPLSIWPFIVILYFFLALCLLWFRDQWFQCVSRQREQDTQKSLCISTQKCGVCRDCSSPPSPCEAWVVLALYLTHRLPTRGSLEPAGLGCLSSFPQLFWCSQFGFGAQLSSIYLSHPHQAGDSNANIATNLAELSDRIRPKLQREKEAAL